MSNEQRTVATSYLAQMRTSGVWDKPIVVRSSPTPVLSCRSLSPGLRREESDASLHPRWDAPKVVAFHAKFPSLWRATFQTG
jgi:peptide-methionine (S)-S-oxide reductase